MIKCWSSCLQEGGKEGGKEGGREMKYASETTAASCTGRFVVVAVATSPILQLRTRTQDHYFSALYADYGGCVCVCPASSLVLR